MVIQAEIVGDEADGLTTFYAIKVSDTSHSWKVKRRYSEFVQLDADLASSGSVLKRDELPEKGTLGIRHRLNLGDFNEKRRTGLDSYLKFLLRQVTTIAQDPVLHTFLQQPAISETAMVDSIQSEQASSIEDTTMQIEAGGNNPTATLGEERSEARVKSASPTRQQIDVPICADPGTLSGKDWDNFKKANRELAEAIECCSQLIVSPRRFQNENEEAFQTLRRLIKKCPRSRENGGAKLDDVLGKAHVWNFLMLVATHRPFYKRQVAEVVKVLEESEAWVAALKDNSILQSSKMCILGE